MYLLGAEDGRGVVRADGSGEIAVEYHFEIWLSVGGYKTARGWITAEHAVLQGLVPAAEVLLETGDGGTWRIEVTGVSGDRAEVRFPDRSPG